MQTGQNSIASENSMPQLGQVRWELPIHCVKCASAVTSADSNMEEYTKLTGKEINKLKPGDWVAWRKERWKPIGRDTEWAEAQLTDRPIRCCQVVFVRFRGIRTKPLILITS